jgi:hypothetical protein
MAIAGGPSVRLLKGTRGKASWRKLDELPLNDSDDSEVSGPGGKKNRVKGPSKRACKLGKFQSYAIFVCSTVLSFFLFREFSSRSSFLQI